MLGLGGVDGGDLGTQGDRPGGVPAEPAAEVEHAQPCHLADGLDAGPRVDPYDAGPWLAETQSPCVRSAPTCPPPVRCGGAPTNWNHATTTWGTDLPNWARDPAQW